jgi:abhydrolase domain-containing protein 12
VSPCLVSRSYTDDIVENDWDIPYTHSDALFDALLEHHLPSVPADYDALKSPSLDQFTEVQGIIAERKAKKAEVVKTTVVKHFGEVKEFDDEGRSVTYVKMHTGWHDYVGTQETMQDIIREKFYTERK